MSGAFAPPASRPPLAFSDSVAHVLSESGFHVVVTGAGGWIGQATLEMVEAALGEQFPSRVHAFGKTQRLLHLRSGRSVVSEPLERLRDLNGSPNLLVHLGFVTREQVGPEGIQVYEALNEHIATTVLDHVRRGDVEGMFLPSSGAVYNEQGEPQADFATNPYGFMKLRDEERFANACRRPDRAAVVRVFNLAGPFLNKTSLYALGSIITDLFGGGPVRLRADHRVIRSYVHVADLVELAFAVMLGLVQGPGAPIDTAGEREVEIGELAVLVAALMGLPQVRIERPRVLGAAAVDRYVGDGTQMRSLAARWGRELAVLEDQILDTADYLWELQKPGYQTFQGAVPSDQSSSR